MKKILAIIACSVCCEFAAAQSHYTLEQILDSALWNNIAIRSAIHDIEAAQQQRKEAFAKYFPNISATGMWFNANKSMAKMDMMGMSILIIYNLRIYYLQFYFSRAKVRKKSEE